MAALNKKQRRFVEEYLLDLNGTQAAIRAGYSPKTAGWIAQQLLTKTHVAKAVREGMDNRSKRTKISQDRVLQEYAKIAFFDPRQLYSASGELIPIQDLPADVAAAIAGMDVAVERAGETTDGVPVVTTVRKLKLVDKKGALDSVARHLGMFNDKVALTGENGGPVVVEHKLPESIQEKIREHLEQQKRG